MLILPSERIIEETKDVTMSTVVYRNQKWFEEGYVTRISDPLEPNFKTLPLEIGKMYSFAYDPIYKDQLDFYDFMPINLILGYTITKKGRLNPYGINLSYIPPKTRTAVLDVIVKTFRTQYINPNITRISEENFNLKRLPMTYDIAKKILHNSGFEFAIRSYRYSNIGSKPRIITYEDWWKPCTFTSKFIKEMNIRGIYYRYKRNLDDKYRIGQKDKPVDIKKTKVKDIKEYIKKRDNK
jgi:hypothetical protein